MKHCKLLYVSDPNIGQQGLKIVQRHFTDVTPIIWKRGDRPGKMAARRQIRAGRWDMCLSFYNDLVFKKADLDTMRLAVNFHPALPEIAGLGYDVVPLIENHATYGVSVHFIDDEQIDAGAIIDVEEDRLPPHTTYSDLRKRNQVLCLRLLQRIVPILAKALSVEMARHILKCSSAQLGRQWAPRYVTKEALHQMLTELRDQEPNHLVFQ